MNKNFLNCSPRDKRRILGKASHLAKTNLQRAREYEDTDDYDYEVEKELQSRHLGIERLCSLCYKRNITVLALEQISRFPRF